MNFWKMLLGPNKKIIRPKVAVITAEEYARRRLKNPKYYGTLFLWKLREIKGHPGLYW